MNDDHRVGDGDQFAARDHEQACVYLVRAEQQRRAHVALLEDMERIDQAIRQETDVERMLQSEA